MTVAQRIATCRLIEQIQQKQDYCREIGLVAVVKIRPDTAKQCRSSVGNRLKIETTERRC